ncbi:MAG: mannose-1-phosphate guanylyltransferase [Myxococcota bacterium]|jgi:mannose-1-phosphate guanylyltransferase
MNAMVFCAGLGTRMRPYTDRLPKPAMPLFGRPLIGHTLRWLASCGVTRTVINVHHQADVMRRVAQQSRPEGMSLVFSDEPEILGTGGALVAARQHFADDAPVLVVNGDAFLSLDVTEALAMHAAFKPGATLVLTDDPRHEALFGVGCDGEGRVTDFWGAPSGDRAVARHAYTGIHILSPSFIDALPQQGFACVKEAGWIPWLEAGRELRCVVAAGDWFDLGTPERYLAAHRELWPRAGALSGLREVEAGVFSAEPLPPELTVTGPAVLGARLIVEGPASVGPGTVIGRNVVLPEGAQLSGAVVWDGSTVVVGADSGIMV